MGFRGTSLNNGWLLTELDEFGQLLKEESQLQYFSMMNVSHVSNDILMKKQDWWDTIVVTVGRKVGKYDIKKPLDIYLYYIQSKIISYKKQTIMRHFRHCLYSYYVLRIKELIMYY